jgi:hypothetical protein
VDAENQAAGTISNHKLGSLHVSWDKKCRFYEFYVTREEDSAYVSAKRQTVIHANSCSYLCGLLKVRLMFGKRSKKVLQLGYYHLILFSTFPS